MHHHNIAIICADSWMHKKIDNIFIWHAGARTRWAFDVVQSQVTHADRLTRHAIGSRRPCRSLPVLYRQGFACGDNKQVQRRCDERSVQKIRRAASCSRRLAVNSIRGKQTRKQALLIRLIHSVILIEWYTVCFGNVDRNNRKTRPVR